MSEATRIVPSRPEVQEKVPSPRDVAVDFGEYFAIYQLGRGEYDRASDRAPELTRLTGTYPFYADRINLLDAHLERAIEIRKGFITSPLSRDDYDNRDRANGADNLITRASAEDWKHLSGLVRTLKRPHRGDSSAVYPPDYTFSAVRHPIARPLLDLLNIAMVVDDAVIENGDVRSSRLKENGRRMVDVLLGQGADTHKLLRIKEADVLTAVFEGRLFLPTSPGKPVSQELTLSEESLGELNGTGLKD